MSSQTTRHPLGTTFRYSPPRKTLESKYTLRLGRTHHARYKNLGTLHGHIEKGTVESCILSLALFCERGRSSPDDAYPARISVRVALGHKQPNTSAGPSLGLLPRAGGSPVEATTPPANAPPTRPIAKPPPIDGVLHRRQVPAATTCTNQRTRSGGGAQLVGKCTALGYEQAPSG